MKRIIFCVKTEMRVETFDFTDPKVRKQFHDMGLVLRARDKI